MATAKEHYAEAERLLADMYTWEEDRDLAVAEALVHAQLAHVATLTERFRNLDRIPQ